MSVGNLKIDVQGFGQKERSVGFGFLVENPNPNMAVENSKYQVAFFGSDGSVVDTDSGYIEVIAPGQKLGIGGTTFVNEGVTVARIEVQLSTGNTVLSDPIPDFVMEAVGYQASDISSYATGVMHSPFNRDISNFRVSAVAYDNANNIVGGGFTYANFLLANSARGVEVSVTCSPNVARIEIYPTLSGLSALTSTEGFPDGANPLTLLRYGYGQDERQYGFGLVLQNSNGNYSVESSEYNITAYASDGHVLGVEEGNVEVVLPSQTLGIADTGFLAGSDPIARMNVQIQTGKLVSSEALPIFTAENISYQPDQFFSKLTGQIVNPYARDVSNLRVSAILYDSAGNIIGGGFTYLDFVPASGRAAAEVSVTSTGQPSGAELYATVSALSDIK